MIETEVRIIPNFAEIPKTPKATFLDWFKYYIYNILRKPKVRRKKKELLFICSEVKMTLTYLLYPELLKSHCKECLDIYRALSSQVYLSSIEMILKNYKCLEHSHLTNSFYEAHKDLFNESEKIARWINGFV